MDRQPPDEDITASGDQSQQPLAELPTGLVWEWRARFFGALLAFAMIALDEPSRVVFCLGVGFCTAAFIAANAFARVEVRVRRMKARRR